MTDAGQVASALIGAGGLVGAIVAYRRFPVDRDRVVVSLAEGAVIVQSGVIKDLRDQLLELRESCEECERDRHVLRGELDALRRRINGRSGE